MVQLALATVSHKHTAQHVATGRENAMFKIRTPSSNSPCENHLYPA